MAAPLLEVSQLQVRYGAIGAVHGVDLEVNAGELVTVIGANGAGKTSTLKAIMGLVPAASGQVSFDGRALDAVPIEQRTQLGLAMSPEGRRVFAPLSVRENLAVGGVALPPADVDARIDAMVVRFPILGERIDQLAGTLSGGEQQMLAIARALMSQPRCLVLDEPSLGLAPKIVSQVFELIAELHAEGVAVLLVEQNVQKSLAIADRAYVMELGRIVLSGAANELARDNSIQDRYLGAS
ncbi:MAG: ABC transporter ATP-binding protein [Pseudomonadota bacterium]